jgi:cardiolipin synthase
MPKASAEVVATMRLDIAPEPLPTRWRVIGDMGSFASEVLSRIKSARHRVCLECFIVRSDRLGGALADALVAAVGRGVCCRLLYDPLGSRKSKRRFFDDLRNRGVEVRAFGRLGPLLVGRPIARNHARMIVVDDAAFTGGHAWGDEWLPTTQGGQGWHDVCVGLEGPLVAACAQLFEQHWEQAVSHTIGDSVSARHAGIQLVSDAPIRRSLILTRHLEAIRQAKRRVWIENAYFFPTRSLLRALLAAGRRGVDVKILLPSRSDLPLVQRAARAQYRHWMRAGIEVWEYQDVVLHAKFALVDDDWCFIGTFNANAISVAFAIEVGLMASAPTDVAQTARQFETDLRSSRRIDEAHLRARPLWQRILDRLCSLLLGFANLLLQRPPARIER